MEIPDPKKLVVICGPTSSGKSGLAMKLAPKFNGEIVIADSRQVYKQLDIGTAKPTPAEQKTVPHHLVDICEPGDDFSVGKYKKIATKAIAVVHRSGNLPFLVGGTGLYIDALTQGYEIPAVSPDSKLRSELEKKSLEQLYSEIKELDPLFATRVDRKNKRRLIRAIEVCQKTGRRFSDQRKKTKPPYDVVYLALDWPRAELYQRIDQTVDKMMAAGLKKEVSGLIDSGVSADWLLSIGLEYRYLTKIVTGDLAEADGIQQLKYASHQFAKRQLTWFRRNKKIHWLDPAQAVPEASGLLQKFLQR